MYLAATIAVLTDYIPFRVTCVSTCPSRVMTAIAIAVAILLLFEAATLRFYGVARSLGHQLTYALVCEFTTLHVCCVRRLRFATWGDLLLSHAMFSDAPMPLDR